MNGLTGKTRVFVCTDLNTVGGDPDDMQSMAHILLYADQLDIVGVAPDRWGAGGHEEVLRILNEKYRPDYLNPTYRFREYGYPTPSSLAERVMSNPDDASNLLVQEAQRARSDGVYLYVLVWGQMCTVRDALIADPSISESIRLLTIGTNLRPQHSGGDGKKWNWNNGSQSCQHMAQRRQGLSSQSPDIDQQLPQDGSRALLQKLDALYAVC